MAVENDVIEVPEGNDAAAEAAFAEQFNESPVEHTADEETENEVQELQPDTEQTAEQVDEVAGEETPEQQVEDEHAKLLALLNDIPARNDLTEKEIRQIHGKFGEVNRALQELKNSNSGAANVRVTKDQFKRLNEEFPEIAEMLAEDLAGISFPSGGGVSAESVQPFVNTEVAKVREELTKTMNTNLLTIQHRDWTTVYGSEDFSTWKANQPPEVQHELDNSWDAMYLGEQLTKFKTWRDTVKNTKEKNNERLLKAVLPKGGTKAQNGLVSEEDAFNAQFK